MGVDSIEAVDEPGLNDNSFLMHKMFALKTTSITDHDLQEQYDRTGPTWRHGVLEQCLIDPDFRYQLLKALQSLGDDLDMAKYTFFRERLSLYQDIREQELYQKGYMTQAVEYLDTMVEEHKKRGIEQEMLARDRAKEFKTERSMRVELMEAKTGNKAVEPSAACAAQQHAYNVLPGRNTERNKKAKARKARKKNALVEQNKWVSRKEWTEMKCAKAIAARDKQKGVSTSRQDYSTRNLESDMRELIKERKKARELAEVGKKKEGEPSSIKPSGEVRFVRRVRTPSPVPWKGKSPARRVLETSSSEMQEETDMRGNTSCRGPTKGGRNYP